MPRIRRLKSKQLPLLVGSGVAMGNDIKHGWSTIPDPKKEEKDEATDKDNYANGYWWDVGVPATDSSVKSPVCNHEYKYYQGFTEDYWFCIKCDEKMSKLK